MKALEAMNVVKIENREVLKKEPWLRLLFLTKENRVNMEHLNSLAQLKDNQTFLYVKKTLLALEEIKTTQEVKEIVEEVLKWSEVAKSGMPSERARWLEKGYNLAVHNEASASIYEEFYPNNVLVKTLIETHGYIGQFIRGEVSLFENKKLTELVEFNFIEKEKLNEIILVLNECILKGVSEILWKNLKNQVFETTKDIVDGKYEKENSLKERIRKLRHVSILSGENFEKNYHDIFTNEVKMIFSETIRSKQLWFIESALYDFTLEEFTKIFLLIAKKQNINSFKHITLEELMNQLYYDYKGEKVVNIYKKRIIEKYLREVTIKDILSGKIPENKHVSHEIEIKNGTLSFNFLFSSMGEKLIDFCLEAEKEDMVHEKAIILLFDLFNLRRDSYDRFHNEEKYLRDMNASGDFKKIILEKITGENVIDIGPGGGIMLDLIEEKYPSKKVYGIDISKNVIQALEKKKQLENKKWEVVEGDALNLKNYFKEGEIDTIIYSSIIHELYSYIPTNGKKFNTDTIKIALSSAYDVLSEGGRIIIRDGIMSEPENDMRIIEFKDKKDMTFLNRYVNDFKGRKINIEKLSETKVKMPINDAMEFLYTYTWGEESYVHEINEQFGYFTPSKYKEFIQNVLGEKAKIVEFNHYLQEGYSEHLLKKICLYDENEKEVELPDSTCFIVIEKSKSI